MYIINTIYSSKNKNIYHVKCKHNIIYYNIGFIHFNFFNIQYLFYLDCSQFRFILLIYVEFIKSVIKITYLKNNY